MKNILTFLILLFAITAQARPQQIDKITARCQSPYQSRYSSVALASGNINYTPCPNGMSILTGNIFLESVKMIDSLYTSGIFANTPFTMGTVGNKNYAGGFASFVSDISINGTGNNNFYTNSYNNLAVGGAATNARIFGALYNVSNRANGVVLTSTATIEGIDIFTNIETPATTAYGVFAYASTGSVDAAGTGTISAINGSGGIHNGGATLVNAGEFRIFNAASGAATAVTSNIIRGQLTNNAGNTITNFHGLSFDTWTNAGTITAGSSVIFADSSVNVTGVDYFINSASNKPAKLAGDVYVSDNTKGIILKSPDNSCYRFTVANGGALNAGVLVTCP